jgi:hypothetical protein
LPTGCNEIAGAADWRCMAIAEHLVAHTRRGVRSLLEPVQASWLWGRLRHNFDRALSCELMPDHVHMMNPRGGRDRLIHVLGAFTTRFGVQFDVMPAEVANTTAIAARMVRYGFFNPVRAGLVDDPWEWRWSTLRDLLGVSHPIWTARDAVAKALAIAPSKLLGVLTNSADHRIVTPQPVSLLTVTTAALRQAVGAVLRLDDDEVAESTAARRLVVQAADAIEIPGVRRLAAQLGRSERTLYRDRATRHPALDAVLLCLGDPRLREGPSRYLTTSRTRTP